MVLLTSSSLLSRMSWLSVRMQYFLSHTLGSEKGDWPQEKRCVGGPFTSVHRGHRRHVSGLRHGTASHRRLGGYPRRLRRGLLEKQPLNIAHLC